MSILNEYKKAGVKRPLLSPFTARETSMLALAGSLRFLLALDRGFFIMFPLTNFSQNASSGALPLKPPKSTLERFVFFYANFSHLKFPPSVYQRGYIFSGNIRGKLLLPALEISIQ